MSTKSLPSTQLTLTENILTVGAISISSLAILLMIEQSIECRRSSFGEQDLECSQIDNQKQMEKEWISDGLGLHK